MRKTSIRVLFEIFGDDFPVEKITEILNIKPSSISRKGEKINDVAYKKETAWSIDTGEIESLDLNDQIQQILVLIKDKEDVFCNRKVQRNAIKNAEVCHPFNSFSTMRGTVYSSRHEKR
ncbi:DUF4279 domain-containing protein [Heyndrickxia coagulans]|uniref:DUF4279 domain-containing protein n=1 Tax=Heyndrickxia coagulans TaxID=1398 RepID=UPI003D24F25A